MPANKRISVIVPFFNAKSTLNRCIRSIQEQSYTNFECILVDNNSSDRGAFIASEVCGEDERFRLISEKKQGVVHAFERGYKASRGEFIARMDADDEMLPERLESQLVYLKKNKEISAVAGLVEYAGDEKVNEGFARFVRWSNSVLSEEDLLKKRFIEFPVVNPTLMFRREAIERYGLYKSGDFPEDYELYLRWLSRGARIAKLDEKVLRWYDSPARLTRTNAVYREEAFYKIKTRYLVEELRKVNRHFPYVYIWGSSRLSRKRAALLSEHGIQIRAYIDIHKKRVLKSSEVIHFDELPEPGDAFILVYLGMEKAREQIAAFLISRGFEEGKGYLFVS